jgi:O-antigen/teichoic acid export membrane protein
MLGMGNFLGPKLSNAISTGGKKKLRSAVLKWTIATAPVFVFFCFIIFLYGGNLIEIVYGSEYSGNDKIIKILALSKLTAILAQGSSFGLWAMERADINFKINLSSLVLTVVLGTLLVKLFGALGAAYGLLISRLVALFFQIFYFNYLTKINKI